jgi:hypothetical protein
MDIFFSICSNNYLAQVSVLRKSIQHFHPEIPFFLFLCDQKLATVHYESAADEVIELENIEPGFGDLALKYNIVELNTCLKPRVFEYLFLERNFQRAIFLDPDIRLFDSVSHLFSKLLSANLLLTPHILSPIPMDGKTPREQTFLIFGLYNLGFLGVSHSTESLNFLQWWKQRTYEHGFIDTYKGIFVDQLPVNLVPVFFQAVQVLHDPGLNMAPWNLHERELELSNGKLLVNGSDSLKFYHFSSFKAGNIELPLHHYNRFLLKDRPDLLPIYQDYNKDLLEAGYATYQQLPNAYASGRKEQLNKNKKQKWIRKFLR